MLYFGVSVMGRRQTLNCISILYCQIELTLNSLPNDKSFISNMLLVHILQFGFFEDMYVNDKFVVFCP